MSVNCRWDRGVCELSMGQGCADGTQETIETAMAGVPGQLLSQEFVDFSTTRNWALRVRP